MSARTFLIFLIFVTFLIFLIFGLLSLNAFAGDSEFNWWQRITGVAKDPCTRLSSTQITELRPNSNYSERVDHMNTNHHVALNRLSYKHELKEGPIKAKMEYLFNVGETEAAEELESRYQISFRMHADHFLQLIKDHEQSKKELCQELFPNSY